MLSPLNAKKAFKQGWNSLDEGLYNQAYNDFTQALTQEPGFAQAWFARAWTEEKRAHRAHAIEDYSHALSLRPDDVQSLLSRGVLRLYDGNFSNAAKDFKAMVRFAKPTLERYALLWLYVADKRTGVEHDPFFVDRMAGANLTPWPGIVLKYLNGQARRADIESDIRRAASEDKRRQRSCVAYYFLGQKALIDGNRAQAKKDFQRAVDTAVTHYRQYEAAKIELKRLSLSTIR